MLNSLIIIFAEIIIALSFLIQAKEQKLHRVKLFSKPRKILEHNNFGSHKRKIQKIDLINLFDF